MTERGSSVPLSYFSDSDRESGIWTVSGFDSVV